MFSRVVSYASVNRAYIRHSYFMIYFELQKKKKIGTKFNIVLYHLSAITNNFQENKITENLYYNNKRKII